MPIFIGIGALCLIIIAMLVLVAMRPAEFRIQRSAQIDAPCDVIFAIINDLRRWSEWSPFEKHDLNMKKTFEGASSGPGASYLWNGNNQVGEGRLTIVESKPSELVSMNLEFNRPFKATNKVSFKLEPSQGGTRVSWIMDGTNNFMMKAISLMTNMDKMVGKEFEEGLANLRGIAQAASGKAPSAAGAPANPR